MKLHDLSDKQDSFRKALVSEKYRYLMFGGGFAGGKSYLTSLLIIATALQFPKTRYAIFRKNLTVLKRTSLITFRKVLELIKVVPQWNGQEMKFTFGNGSEIYFIEADKSKDNDFNKLKGLELTACAMEEANEISVGAFNVLKGRIGRENQGNIPAFILLTTNPDQNWVKDVFYDPWSEGKLKEPYYFEEALAKDNPWNSEDYLRGLEDLPENEYERYVKGNWNFSDDPNQLIKYEWIKDHIVDKYEVIDDTIYLGVDVARYGNDRTVFTFIQKGVIYKQLEYKNQDTVTTAEKIIHFAKEERIGYSNIGVDVVGLGAGVVDYLNNKGYSAYPYNSAEKPTSSTDFFEFKNRRAESYWALREAFKGGELEMVENNELKKELLQLKYFVKDKLIYIESKDDIKKRIGLSPDYSDSACIAYWVMKMKTIGTPIETVDNSSILGNLFKETF